MIYTAHTDVFPVDEREYQRLLAHQVRWLDKTGTVSVPQDTRADVAAKPAEGRGSTRIQASLSSIGVGMGLWIWIPRSDRNNVLAEWKGDSELLLSDNVREEYAEESE
jgi:hypothetical protein